MNYQEQEQWCNPAHLAARAGDTYLYTRYRRHDKVHFLGLSSKRSLVFFLHRRDSGIMVPMSNDAVGQMQAWIENHSDEMISTLQEILRIDSIESDAEDGAPFGAGNRAALDWMLSKAAAAGMSTVDMDGYCGYADFGTGERMVMSMGHLDVVPVGPGWKHEPFGAEIDGGYIYSRGACDDKGPTIAMFFATRALIETVGDPGVRVRNLFGCNEESGFKCVEHYLKSGEVPTLGVAPDAGWPCIHGEKGIMNLIVTRSLPSGLLTLKSLVGGQRPNIVIDKATAVVEVAESYRGRIVEAIGESWDKNLSFNWAGNELTIVGSGKAAHGAYPFGGDSAAIRVLRFLREVAPVEQQHVFESLHAITHIGGDGLGIAGSDVETGALTANVGVIETVDGRIKFTYSVRYPATWEGRQVIDRAEAHLAGLDGDFVAMVESDSPSLYFPLDHPLIRTIQEVYEAETGDTKKPGTMGGGTYARAVPNCVAIGTSWVGDGDAHETDERIAVASVITTAKIYCHLLYRLCEVAQTLKS